MQNACFGVPGRPQIGFKKVQFFDLLVFFPFRLRCLPFFVFLTPPKQNAYSVCPGRRQTCIKIVIMFLLFGQVFSFDSVGSLSSFC